MNKNPKVTPDEARTVAEAQAQEPEQPARVPAWMKLRDAEDVRRAMREVGRDVLTGQRKAREAQETMKVLKILLDGLLDEEAEEVVALREEVKALRKTCRDYEYRLLQSATAGLRR